ncbi:methyl-CpG-binding domain protein [Medicago truncatula]|uniref:Methyl-CpG-binding domain protein n=2 Tax=Medicago truncatula TaxID=3880 RepID=A0A072UV12_MEDTR|nr:methyl-CpG-binding domain protein [Medicago truncatula]
MSEVAQIEGRVRYSAFKKTVKVMITPTDSLDNLKAQLNTYFEHLGENQYTRHLFGQMPCIDLGEDRDEYAWKTASYMPLLIRDDGDVGFMFRNMVEDNILYMSKNVIYSYGIVFCNVGTAILNNMWEQQCLVMVLLIRIPIPPEEVVAFLLRCCFQAKSASHLIDALNAEGEHIDVILAKVGLPKKGMRVFKYMARDKELCRIPIIMMSTQDVVSVVVKCLGFGAVDYLVQVCPIINKEIFLKLCKHLVSVFGVTPALNGEDISPDSGGIWGFDELGTPQAPDGWQRLVHFRAEGSSQLGDVYYEAPSGKKLRSMPEVKKFLADHPEYMTDGVTLSRFSFKRPKSQESYVRKRSHAKSVEHKQGIPVSRPAKKRATQSFLHKDAV